MSLNETVSADRVHIGFFGKRNAGKSSLVNAITNQELSVVSNVAGTTTDPVKKAMELLPIGPALIIDTPGLDDEGELGEKRVAKTMRILRETDIAVLVVDANAGLTAGDEQLISLFRERNIPFLVAYNKADLLPDNGTKRTTSIDSIYTSTVDGRGVEALKNRLGDFASKTDHEKRIVADLLQEGDVAILVTPIDESAPKGRLILPQQQTLRELLDAHCIAIVCQDTELKETLAKLAVKPAIVITDSQVFENVAKDVPCDIPLTSFSILFARYKGSLDALLEGADALANLKDGDRVLVSEGCTHHRQCNDIGTVKIPKWIEKTYGVKPCFSFTQGTEFPDDLSEYALVIHCGGCMLNEKEMKARIGAVKKAGVPIVNYGCAIAKMHGILDRSCECLKPNSLTTAH